jgi:hypothetical protein
MCFLSQEHSKKAWNNVKKGKSGLLGFGLSEFGLGTKGRSGLASGVVVGVSICDAPVAKSKSNSISASEDGGGVSGAIDLVAGAMLRELMVEKE